MAGGGSWSRECEWVTYRLIPPLFMVFFTGMVEVLALVGKGTTPSIANVTSSIVGSTFSWCLVVSYFLWAFIWLKIPSKKVFGPTSPDGYAPEYQNNGVQYYFGTMGMFICLEVVVWPGIYSRIYDETPAILGSLTLCAMAFCFYLYNKGKATVTEDLPPLYLFYRGVELHPRIMGVDVKQLTNCRIGVMSWQLLVLAYYVRGLQHQGFYLASFTNFFLQTIYLGMFYVWEDGYFSTLDMTLDRAGYYICWGCLVWVPCLYTYSAYWMASRQPLMSTSLAAVLLAAGVVLIALKCKVDFERTWFRSTGRLYGRVPSHIVARYSGPKGRTCEAKLLTSGSWGVARHLNYTYELLATLCWTLPGFGLGYPPFFYFVFVFILLMHRLFRDEDKCANRYGKYWQEYCTKVPYRLIPHIF